MTPLLVGLGMGLALALVFVVTLLPGDAGGGWLRRMGRSGLLAVLVACGLALAGGSLAFGLQSWALAPPMFVTGLMLLALAGLSALRAGSTARQWTADDPAEPDTNAGVVAAAERSDVGGPRRGWVQRLRERLLTGLMAAIVGLLVLAMIGALVIGAVVIVGALFIWLAP